MKYLFFDLETTGFSSENDSVIEIAAAVYDSDKDEILDTFQSFINPGKRIPPKITEITSITDSDVRDAPTEVIVFEQFAEFLERNEHHSLAGHNIISFDMKWLHVRNKRFNLKMNLDLPLLDTLPYVKEVAKKELLVGYNFKTPKGYPSFKLEYLMEYFELGDQNHRAIDDVLNNIKVFKNLLKLEEEDTSLGF